LLQAFKGTDAERAKLKLEVESYNEQLVRENMAEGAQTARIDSIVRIARGYTSQPIRALVTFLEKPYNKRNLLAGNMADPIVGFISPTQLPLDYAQTEIKRTSYQRDLSYPPVGSKLLQLCPY